MKPTYILGLNTFHADSGAALLKDGRTSLWQNRIQFVRQDLVTEGLIDGSIHGPLSVELVAITNTSRPDLVVYWGTGESSMRCFDRRYGIRGA